jgi:hypothetical protein
VTDPGHQQGVERRARREQDQEGHAATVSEDEGDGSGQRRDTAGGYRPAVPAAIILPAAWRRMPATQVLRWRHQASLSLWGARSLPGL